MAGGRRKVRWRSSSPLRGSPPLTWPRMAMPFDRPPASWLFAPRISDTNKWCKSTSRKRQEAELRTRIAKHLSGRVRLPGADTYTHHETVSEQNSATQAPEGGNQDENQVAPPGGWGPSKGSLALILPTAWVPSAHRAADGHAFRSAHGTRSLAPRGY